MPRFRQEDPFETPIELIPEGAEMMEEVETPAPKKRGRPKAETPSPVESVAPSAEALSETPEETPVDTAPPISNTEVVLSTLSTPEALVPIVEEAPGMPIAHKTVAETENIIPSELDPPLHHLAALPLEESVSNQTESLSTHNPLELMQEPTSFEMFSDEPGTKVERFLAEYRLLQNTEQGGDNLFWAAMQYRQDGLPGKARQLLQAFIKQYATHPKVPDAQKELYWLDVDTPSESQLFSYEDLSLNAPKTEVGIVHPVSDMPDMDFTAASDLPETNIASDEIFLPPPPKTEIGLGAAPSVLATEVPQPRYKPENYDAEEMRRKTEKRFSDLEKRSEGNDLWSRFSGNIIGIVIAALISLILIWALYNFFQKNNTFSNTASNNLGDPATPQTEDVRVATPNEPYATLESKLKGENFDNAPSAEKAPLQAKATIDPAIGGFGWQFKHTTRKFEADSLAYGLRQRGYRAGVIDGPERFGKPGYRVVVGQFKTKEMAKAKQSNLPFDAPSDVWVVDIK